MLRTKEEGTHMPLAKEPQGSVKGKNKPREMWDRERSREKGEGYLNKWCKLWFNQKDLADYLQIGERIFMDSSKQ
jgi:hypothetical protein